MKKSVSKPADRRVRKTEKALRNGLVALMKAKSIKDISVRELTEQTDINRGTFYLHYADIFDLVEKMEDDLMAQFHTIFAEAAQQELPNSLGLVLHAVLELLSQNADLCRVLMSKNGDIAFVDRINQLVREKCSERWEQIYPEGKVEVFNYYYSFVASGCVGLFTVWLENDCPDSVDEMAQLCEKMILNGLPSGRAEQPQKPVAETEDVAE